MKKTPILTLILGAAMISTLAGCTTAATTDAKAPTASPTASATASPKLLDHRNTCVDGVATITEDTTLEKGCDHVAILADDLKVTLGGTTKILYIEGNGNTIKADTIVALNAAGTKNNTITYTGAQTDVKDAGESNTITKK
jgi:PBP1b-binding outer membrane lipoprotein LpoB